MNRFANHEISLLQIVEGEGDAPVSFLFRSDEGRPPLVVDVPLGLGQLAIGEPGGAPLSLAIESLASPGRSVVVGGRELHLQFLRATNPLCRGPLLVFEQGEALPCFVAKRGLWQRLTRSKEKAVVPVYLVGAGDEASRRREIEAGLNVALELLKGRVAPGLDEAAYVG